MSNTNRDNQGGTFCRPEKKGKGRVSRTSNKWCTCGFKKHGPNHENGAQHKHGKES